MTSSALAMSAAAIVYLCTGMVCAGDAVGGSGGAGPSRGGQPDLLPLLGWVGGGVALAIVAGVLLVAVRKQALSRQSQASESASMFHQIRDLRDRGELSEEEFNAIRTKLVERARGTSPSTSTEEYTRKPLTQKKVDSFHKSEGSDGLSRSERGDV